MHDHQAVLDRLASLERDNRRWRLVGGLLALAVIASVSIGFVSPPADAGRPSVFAADVVEAERFVLKGADGAEVGSLGLDAKGNPTLLMRKDSSYVLLTLSAPGLLIRGPDGKRSAFLGIDSAGSTLLELTSDRLQEGVKLATHEDGSSSVTLRDAAGYPRATMEALATGDSIYTVRGEKGAIRGTFGLDSKGNASSLLLDATGGRRIGMVVQADGTPILSMEDNTARARANLTTKFDGSPTLELLREDGTPSFEAP